MAKVLVPIANGSEDIEAITIIDVLRRGGVEVVVASIHDELQVTAARGSRITADVLISNIAGYQFADGTAFTLSDELDGNVLFDAIALPGGLPGAEHLRDCDTLIELIEKHDIYDAIIAAICASPAVVLGTHGFLVDREATCYPGFEDKMVGAHYVADQPVIMDENFLTSRGPATAMVFALALLANLVGYEEAEKVAAALLC